MKPKPPQPPTLCVDCGHPVSNPGTWGGASLHGSCRSKRGGKGSREKTQRHCGLSFNPKSKQEKPL